MNIQTQPNSRYKVLSKLISCLYGEIPKSLLLGSIVWEGPNPCLYFYFPGTVLEQDKKTIEAVHRNFQVSFLHEPLETCGLAIIETDEPTHIKYKGECFFAAENTLITTAHI